MLSEPQMPTIHPAVQAAENWLPPSVGPSKVEKNIAIDQMAIP